MKTLTDNQELYDYLLYLASALRQAGANRLADLVTCAARQASSISTEFLGESRIALQQVLDQENGVLTQQARDDLEHVIEQLNRALDQR